MRILIDGMDLSGKSTLATGLVIHLQRRGVTARRNVGGLTDSAAHRFTQRAYRLRPPGDGLVGWGFVATALSDALRPLPPRGVLVQEAYTQHTIALAEGFGHPSVGWTLRVLGPVLPHFDHLFYLGASLETRRARYAARGQNDALDALIFQDPARFQRIEATLRALMVAEGATVIETDGLGAEEVLQRVIGVAFEPNAGRDPRACTGRSSAASAAARTGATSWRPRRGPPWSHSAARPSAPTPRVE